MGAIRKFLKLGGTRQRLALQALAAVVRSSVAVHLLPFSRITRSFKRQNSIVANSSPYSPEQIAWSVAAVGRRVPGASCLAQALALARMLASHGYRSDVEIGVTRSKGRKIAAHAWVRHNGQVILGGDSDAYHVIARFPSDDTI
jgi:hypothetical protein